MLPIVIRVVKSGSKPTCMIYFTFVVSFYLVKRF